MPHAVRITEKKTQNRFVCFYTNRLIHFLIDVKRFEGETRVKCSSKLDSRVLQKWIQVFFENRFESSLEIDSRFLRK